MDRHTDRHAHTDSIDSHTDSIDRRTDASAETYNPWSVVNLVFRHLADEGLHPVLGECGDPGRPAAELLKTLGIAPAAQGNRKVASRVSDELARLREAFEADNPRTTPADT